MKNITTHYRLLLDEILERGAAPYRSDFVRAANGHTQIFYTPDVDKNSNRGTRTISRRAARTISAPSIRRSRAYPAR